MRSYRASSLGSCTKAQIALQLGYSPLATPDKVEGWYERGRDHEVECLVAMEAEGWTLAPGHPKPDTSVMDTYNLGWDEEQFYVELPVAGALVTGHLDGVAWHNHNYRHLAGDCLVEIKSPQSFHKWERAHKTSDYSDPLMNRYAWQGSVYMLATGLEMVVACVEDSQVKTFGVELPPYTLEQVIQRVEFMEEWADNGALPSTCSQADYPCPVAYLHEKAEFEPDEMLDQLVSDYAFDSQMIKEWEGKKARHKKAIEEYVDGDVETAESKVTLFTTTRKTYDYDSMERDGIDLSKYITEKATESVRITKKEGGS